MATHNYLLCVSLVVLISFQDNFAAGPITYTPRTQESDTFLVASTDMHPRIRKPHTRATCETLAQVSSDLWAADVNRLPAADITLNYQAHVPDNTNTDHATARLFTQLNENVLSGPTYTTFTALLNNYDPDKGDLETQTQEELRENNAFLDAALGTNVMNVLLNFLKCKGLANNQAELRSLLTKIWFDFYPRSGSSSVKDTSGFEHIMVGEYKSTTTVNGFHNWLSFYLKEKAGQINYFGYVNKNEPGLIGAAFKWNNRLKTLGSFLIGVSPEFDIALYTLCFLTNPNKRCPVVLNGYTHNVQTYNTDGHLATAYIEA